MGTTADLDVRDGSPILDLKPYILGGDAIPEAVTPEWLMRSRPPPITNTVLNESLFPLGIGIFAPPKIGILTH